MLLIEDMVLLTHLLIDEVLLTQPLLPFSFIYWSCFLRSSESFSLDPYFQFFDILHSTAEDSCFPLTHSFISTKLVHNTRSYQRPPWCNSTSAPSVLSPVALRAARNSSKSALNTDHTIVRHGFPNAIELSSLSSYRCIGKLKPSIGTSKLSSVDLAFP